MKFEQFPSSANETIKDNGLLGIFDRLAEKMQTPALKKKLMFLMVMGVALTTSKNNPSLENNELTDSNQIIASLAEGPFKDQFLSYEEDLTKVDLPEDLLDFTYRFGQTAKEVGGDYVFSDDISGQIPDQANKVIIGSFRKTHNSFLEEGSDRKSWSMSSEDMFLAPADVEMGAGEMVSMSGVGLSKEEAIASALREIVNSLGMKVDTERDFNQTVEGGEVSDFQSSFVTNIKAESVHYLANYRLTGLSQEEVEEGSEVKFVATVEAQVGTIVDTLENDPVDEPRGLPVRD